MRKYIGSVLVIAVIALLVVVVTKKTVPQRVRDDGRVRVAASFYPLAEFARQVGGEFVTVETLTPAGVEPHDFEPTPNDIARLYDADLLLVNGGIDAWVTDLVPSAVERGVTVLEMREVIDGLLPAGDDDHDDFDPHFWLYPVHAQRQVAAMRDALIAHDGAHASAYRANAGAFLVQLIALDRAYADGLATCGRRIVVTSHAAFQYLADAYDFEVLAIAGLSPDVEPSAGTLAAIAREARTHGVRHVFFETLVSHELAETLAREIGAATLVFNPLEGLTDAERASGASYLSVMGENLTNLRTAMACQ
ncbi:MAG: zinc ABC transporter substrate-binding protein [bacterium]|nr:zinc ABC transporter substrate-binding protein [bacterium]